MLATKIHYSSPHIEAQTKKIVTSYVYQLRNVYFSKNGYFWGAVAECVRA